MTLPVLAAIDVGTNSLHLVIARMRVGGRFDILAREKVMVRLGHGGGDMKRLKPDAIERSVEALARMKQLADASSAPVRAVATSAVREADNADEFINAAAGVGVTIETISGLEEARLIHLGILQAVPVFDRRLILVDIGGGSTEVLIGEQGRVIAARSFKLGAVRLTDRFFPDGTVTDEATRECRAFIRSALATFEREVRRLGFEVAVASSGTAESIARIANARSGAAQLRTYNCFEFTRDDVDNAVDAILGASSQRARLGIAGMEPDRADIIAAGSLILEGVCDAFGIKTILFSEYALREGVLLDTFERHRDGTLHHLRDVSRRSIQHLAERCDDDLVHSAHVARLALELFDSSADIHGLDPSCRDYLEAGALLANVGLVISHSKHHLHSYYVIRNSDELSGFTDHEIEIIALIARYHRKSAPKGSHGEFAKLDQESQGVVRALAAVLRVAIGLDRSHDQRVESVSVVREGQRLAILVHPARRSINLDLEFYSARERSDLLAEITGLEVEFRVQT